MSKAINSNESESIMSKNTNAKATKTSNATTIVAAKTDTNTQATVTTVVAPTKADKARAIFGEAYADKANVPQRKDIINRMVNEAGLTKAGAATYLQNMKKKAGLVQSKVTTATPTA